ncbi:hypothetical protein HYC85_002435 [Camellia sinensis]|uniref:Uncharacterized protein n=1 Tax=Camellia sinensis TaxID=4442 RepID=A0A7J7I9P1_CAMSI|nr:hypothetical protein HYC85_002435 [Camellia sinensis]
MLSIEKMAILEFDQSLLFIVNGERTGKLQALFLLLYFPKANGERTGKLQALFLLLYFPKATKRIFLFEKGSIAFHYNNTKPNPNSLELEWVLEDIDRWFTGWRCCLGSCVWGITASC